MTEQQSDERLDAILLMLESIATLNFSRRLTISSKVDGIDAVASGLNMLSEELEASVVEKSKLEASAKALNEALENTKRTLKELERSNQELDAFAYVASHDLKEPLRGIHNYAQFLLEDYGAQLDDEGREKLETLTRLAQRMDGLISALLRFSGVGRAELALSEVSAGDLAREARDSVRAAMEEAGTRVEIAADMPNLTCDPVLAGQVFQNLIGNAIKYSRREHGRVDVGWNGDSRGPVLHVRDNGIGIREKDFESIFRIFRRLHGQNEYGGGLGAGLTIARKIVERHGGRIWVESQFGQGSTFYFVLHTIDSRSE